MTDNLSACRTPIVFFVFNRPEFTRKVFQRIAAVRPTRLLVVADGARDGKPGEQERCDEVRQIVSSVDWPCECLTNFAPRNLGCRDRLVSGLDWVFEQVEEAIILEDDILPDPTFFRFCDEMLERYRSDPRVAMITGFNIVEDRTAAPDSYFFSALTHIWGWATWRRAWQTYDADMKSWPAVKESGAMEDFFSNPAHRLYWTRTFEQMYDGTGPDTWDLQWFYANLVNHGLAVTPGVNLVENVGFGPEATHTIYAGDAPRIPVQPLQFPLRHPPAMVPRRSLDLLDLDRSHCRIPSFPQRVITKLRRVLQKG